MNKIKGKVFLMYVAGVTIINFLPISVFIGACDVTAPDYQCIIGLDLDLDLARLYADNLARSRSRSRSSPIIH